MQIDAEVRPGGAELDFYGLGLIQDGSEDLGVSEAMDVDLPTSEADGMPRLPSRDRP